MQETKQTLPVINVMPICTVDLNTVAMDMIWCPPGTFTMGSPTTEVGRMADREDEHNVSFTKGFTLQYGYAGTVRGGDDGGNRRLKRNAQ